MENIVIGFVFVVASFFLIRLVYKQFFGKQNGCAKGCGGSCSTIEFKADLNEK